MPKLNRAGSKAASAAMSRNHVIACKRAKQSPGLGERQIEFVASTSKVASDGKIIRETAWDSSAQRVASGGRVPKVLAGHIPGYEDGRQPVIGKILPETYRVEPGEGLVHVVEFAPQEVHPEGPRYYAAYRDGFLTDVSVGWDNERLAPESEWASRDIPEVADLDHMETSCVAFGADDGAIKRARSAGRFDVAELLTTLRDARVQSWETYAESVKRDGVTIPLALLRELCTGCADAAIDRFGDGVQAITIRELPETLKEGIRDRIASPAFFQATRIANFEGFTEMEAEAFSAWLYRECTGEWPTAREEEAVDDTDDSSDAREDDGTEPDATRMIKEGHEDCPSDKPFALVAMDGKVLGCHATEDEAKAHEAAIKKSEADDGGGDEDDKSKDGAAAATPPVGKHARPMSVLRRGRGLRIRRVLDALSAGELAGRLPEYAPNTRTSDGAPHQRANVAPTFSQYLEDREGGLTTPTGDGAHRDALPSGGYAIVETGRWPFFGFQAVRADTDHLAVFKDHPAERVLAEIDNFWNSAERYAKFGLQHRRGMLLYGDPGMGKTGCLNLVRERMAAAGEMVLDATGSSPWTLREALHAVREVEPDRPITVIVEDIERWGSAGESELLALLDGQNSIGRCLVIASTNYRDSMSPRMLRHGRFDLHVEVLPPSTDGRFEYLKLKTAEAGDEIEAETLRQIAEDTEGWSYSQLRELVTAHFVQELDLAASMERIAPGSGAPNTADGDEGAPDDEREDGALMAVLDSGQDLDRLADAVELMVSDRADTSNDIRSLCNAIHSNVEALLHSIQSLPEVLAGRIAESLEGQSERARVSNTDDGDDAGDRSGPQPRSSRDAEQNYAAGISAMLGDLSTETKSLKGETVTE